MDDRHEEMKSRVVSSRLSEEYEGHFHLTNAGAAVEQEASTGAQRLAPGLAAHVSGQLLGTLQVSGQRPRLVLERKVEKSATFL